MELNEVGLNFQDEQIENNKLNAQLYVMYSREGKKIEKRLNTFSTYEEKKSFHIDIQTNNKKYVISFYNGFFVLFKDKEDENEEDEVIYNSSDEELLLENKELKDELIETQSELIKEQSELIKEQSEYIELLKGKEKLNNKLIEIQRECINKLIEKLF